MLFFFSLWNGLNLYADDDSSNVDELIQELFLSEIVYPQEENEMQLTSALNWVDHENDSYSLIQLAAEYGITDHLQIGVEVPIQYGANLQKDGVTNIELEALYNFYNNKNSGWSFSGVFAISFPRVSRGLGRDGFAYELNLVSYKSFGKFAFNFTSGIEIPTDAKEETEYALALGHIYKMKELALTLEIADEFDDDEHEVSLAPGAVYTLADDLLLGLAFSVGLTDEAPNWQVLSNITYEFDL